MNETPVALITGSGSRRVGSVIAAELGRRGYSLVLHYRTSKEEAERQVAEFAGRGISAISLQADLADESAVACMFDAVRERLGRLDVLVNAAALWKKIPLEETTAADLREHFDANALGTFLCCKFGGLIMVAQPTGGCIVNIGDWAEIRPYTDYAAYFPSKGAVTALTRSLAVELAARNPRVRVNCLLPGPVMLPDSIGPEEKQAIIEQTLVKREGRPEHIASGVAFLIDNDFVTGVALPIDGGRSIHSN